MRVLSENNIFTSNSYTENVWRKYFHVLTPWVKEIRLSYYSEISNFSAGSSTFLSYFFSLVIRSNACVASDESFVLNFFLCCSKKCIAETSYIYDMCSAIIGGYFTRLWKIWNLSLLLCSWSPRSKLSYNIGHNVKFMWSFKTFKKNWRFERQLTFCNEFIHFHSFSHWLTMIAPCWTYIIFRKHKSLTLKLEWIFRSEFLHVPRTNFICIAKINHRYSYKIKQTNSAKVSQEHHSVPAWKFFRIISKKVWISGRCLDSLQDSKPIISMQMGKYETYD